MSVPWPPPLSDLASRYPAAAGPGGGQVRSSGPPRVSWRLPSLTWESGFLSSESIDRSRMSLWSALVVSIQGSRLGRLSAGMRTCKSGVSVLFRYHYDPDSRCANPWMRQFLWLPVQFPAVREPLPQARTRVISVGTGEYYFRQVADHVPEAGHSVIRRDRLQGGQVQVGDDVPVRRTSGRSGDLWFGTRRHLHLSPDFCSDGPGFIRVVIGRRARGGCPAVMRLIQERPPGAVVRAWCPKRSEEDVL